MLIAYYNAYECHLAETLRNALTHCRQESDPGAKAPGPADCEKIAAAVARVLRGMLRVADREVIFCPAHANGQVVIAILVDHVNRYMLDHMNAACQALAKAAFDKFGDAIHHRILFVAEGNWPESTAEPWIEADWHQ